MIISIYLNKILPTNIQFEIIIICNIILARNDISVENILWELVHLQYFYLVYGGMREIIFATMNLPNKHSTALANTLKC